MKPVGNLKRIIEENQAHIENIHEALAKEEPDRCHECGQIVRQTDD